MKKLLKRRDFLKLCTVAGISTVIGSLEGCFNKGNNGNGPEPEKKGNLRGSIKGEFTGTAITEGTVSLPGSNYSGQIASNGNFEILDILNPQNYKRVKIISSQGINRETNITLQPGDNNAEITMIESDSVTGHSYADYLTVNHAGMKMDSSIGYKVYFYNRSVWKPEGSYPNWTWVRTGAVPPLEYTADAITKCQHVLQNDLPRMSKGAYAYTGITLESEDPNGPGIPFYNNKKNGWLVIILRENQGAPLYTDHFDDNYTITCALISINYYAPQIPVFNQRGYCQDICEWAGFVDALQKNYVSIFADDDHRFKVPDALTDFDVQYAAEIKHRRAKGHREQYGIPDYEPTSNSNGSGVHVMHYLPSISPNEYNNAWDSTNPFSEPVGVRREKARYRKWYEKHEQEMEQRRRRDNRE